MGLEGIFGQSEFSLFNINGSVPEVKAYDYYKQYAIEAVNNLISVNQLQDKNIKFNFDYIQYFDIDGISDYLDGTDIVKINEGVLLKTYKTFYTLASCYSILDDLQNTNNGSIGIKLCYTFADEQQYEMEYHVPLDKKRKIIAEYMSMFAIKFAILHEIGHLFDGHVFYHRSYNELIIEDKYTMTSQINSPISSLDYQTMEMDADAFAISRIIEEIIIMLQEDTLIKSVLNNSNDIFTLFVYSLHCFFKLIKDERKQSLDFKKSTHLPRWIREVINLDCAKTNIKYKAQNIISEYEFEDIIKNACLKAENQYNAITTQTIDKHEIIEQSSEEVLNHYNNITNNWKFLRIKLYPYARARLAN